MLQIPFEELLLFSVFILSFGIRLYFYFNYFLLLHPEEHKKQNATLAVSVIIAAKNEAENLRKFLPNILEQQYANFELILVDDHSTDQSFEIMREFSAKYSNLHCFRQERSKKGKKAAVGKGIIQARHDYLLFTDADCYPASDQWIQSMMNTVSEKVEIVLGYGRYETNNSLLNKLIRYDTMHTGIRYLSFAKKGKAYMGVGRNLLYHRKIFTRSMAFDQYAHFAYGDDDLIVNEMSTKSNTALCLEEGAHTISVASNSWKEFLFQKVRHLSTGKFYKFTDKISLGLEALSRVLVVLSGTILLLLGYWEVLPLIVISLILHFYAFSRALSYLKDKDILKYLAFLEVIHVFFLTCCGLFSLFNKKISWK